MPHRELRTKVLSVRLSPTEITLLNELAFEAGYKSVSTYLRARGLRQIRSSTDRAVIRQLTLIGNNLNQLTRTAHRCGSRCIEKEISRFVFETLRPVIRRLQK